MEYAFQIDRMSREQLLDHVEAIWRGEITITDLEREQLKQEILNRKALSMGDYVQFYAVLLSLVEITRQAQAKKDPDKKLTTAQLMGAALVMYLYRDLPKPEPPIEYDLMWVTVGDDRVCPICAPLNGQILGQGIDFLISTHPGCRCYTVEVPRKRAMDRIGLKEAGAVRAFSEGQKRILEVLAAPFGSPTRKDKLGQFFSARTNFMIGLSETRPLLYFHGFSPRGRRMKSPPTIGKAVTSKIDEDGLWMRAELVPEGKNELADRTWQAALKGEARASTGSVNYLEDHDEHTGEVYTWPIAELSVFDSGDERVPVSDDAVVLPLRALYAEYNIPYTFEAGEDKKENGSDNLPLKASKRNRTKDEAMEDIKKAVKEALAAEKAAELAKQEERDAIRAELQAEMKEEPKYKSTFNIGGKVTGPDSKFAFRATQKEKDEFDKGVLEETDRFLYHLMRPLQAPRAMRVLEESEAAEGAGLIPAPLLNRIVALRDEVSLVPKIGITKMYTNSLTLSIPTGRCRHGSVCYYRRRRRICS